MENSLSQREIIGGGRPRRRFEITPRGWLPRREEFFHEFLSSRQFAGNSVPYNRIYMLTSTWLTAASHDIVLTVLADETHETYETTTTPPPVSVISRLFSPPTPIRQTFLCITRADTERIEKRLARDLESTRRTR